MSQNALKEYVNDIKKGAIKFAAKKIHLTNYDGKSYDEIHAMIRKKDNQLGKAIDDINDAYDEWLNGLQKQQQNPEDIDFESWLFTVQERNKAVDSFVEQLRAYP